MDQAKKNGEDHQGRPALLSSYSTRIRMGFLILLLALVGCEQARQAQPTRLDSSLELPPLTEAAAASQTEDPTAFALYSTLAGKMARMEELLSGISRLIDLPGFRDRLLADAQEFHQLLIESRGLYPQELPVQDHLMFDQAIDHAAAESRMLLKSIKANNSKAARKAIEQLVEQRQIAHAKYCN